MLSHVDLVLVVEHSDGLNAGGVGLSALAVTDHHAEAIPREHLLHEPIRTAALEAVVGSIERQIVRVSPAVTETFRCECRDGVNKSSLKALICSIIVVV